MTVWMLKDAEPLPLKPGQRALRSGLLAQELGRRGHNVVWWTSTFSHHLKKSIFDRDTEVDLMPNVKLKALNVGRYEKNISISRILHHRRLGNRFQRMAPLEAKPDVIISALPILDFPFHAANFCAANGIPLIVDIRDPWPDVFVHKSPAPLRPLVHYLTFGERRRAIRAIQTASSVTAVSNGFLQWALTLAGRAKSPLDRVFYLGHSGFQGTCQMESTQASGTLNLEGKLVFTFIGTFGHSYELELVAMAAKHFEKRCPEIAFVLVGEGHQREALSRNYGGLENLHLVGWKDTREIAGILFRSHVGLVPCRSLPDTVPNKPFEYFAAGLPILSSLEGEMAEIIQHHGLGLSYPAGDLSEFINTIEKVRQDRASLDRWSQNAKREFERLFNSDTIYPEFALHVENVVKSYLRTAKMAPSA